MASSHPEGTHHPECGRTWIIELSQHMLYTLIWERNCFLEEVQDEGGQQLEGESRGLERGRRGRNMGRSWDSCNPRHWAKEMECGFEEGGEKRRDPNPCFSELSSQAPLISLTVLFQQYLPTPLRRPSQLFTSKFVTAPWTENLLWQHKEVNFTCTTEKPGRSSSGRENSLNTKDSYSFKTLRKFQRALQRVGCQLSQKCLRSSILDTRKAAVFGCTWSCSQTNLSLKSLRRVQTLPWLGVSQYNFVWGGNSLKHSWEMKSLLHNLSWIEHWPHGPPYGLTLPSPQAGGRKACWDSILTLCRHQTVRLGMKMQFCTVLLIPSPDQTPLRFAHPSLVAYWKVVLFSGRQVALCFISPQGEKHGYHSLKTSET